MDYKQLSDFRSTTTVTADDLIYSQNTSSGIEQKTTVRQLINFIISNFAPLRVSLPVTSDGQAIYTGLTYTPGLVNVFIIGMRLSPNMYQAIDGVSIKILDADVLAALKTGMLVDVDAIVSTAVADVASMSDVLALYPGNQASIGSLTGNELLSAQQGQNLYSMTSRKFANYVLSTLAPLRTSLAVTADGQANYTTSGYIPILTNLFIFGRRLSPNSYQALDGTNIIITDTDVLAMLKAGMSIEMDALVSLAVSGAATPAQVAALDPANQSSAATLTGTELASIRQGANLVSTTLTKVAQWVLGTFGGFTQGGTGAVARTIVNKLTDIVNVRDFGAFGDGQHDDTIAIQDAINYVASLSRGGTVHYPAGMYLVTATLKVANSYVRQTGEGVGASLIVTVADFNTMEIGTNPITPMVGVDVLDIGFYHTNQSVRTQTHLVTICPLQSVFRNGFTNGAFGHVNYGGQRITFDGTIGPGNYNPTSNAALNSSQGITLAAASTLTTHTMGAGAVDLPTEVEFRSLYLNGPRMQGWQYGVAIFAGEHITFSGDYYVGQSTINNIHIEQDANNKLILETNMESGGYIDAAGQASIYLGGPNGNGSQYIGPITISCNVKGQGGDGQRGIVTDGTVRAGAFAQAVRNLTIRANVSGFANDGILLAGGVNIVVDSHVWGNSVLAINQGSGLSIGPGVTRCRVTGIYGGGTYGDGTGNQTYGVLVDPASKNVTLAMCDLRGNQLATNGVSNAGTSGNRVLYCSGYSGNRPVQTPTMPATTVAMVNPYGTPCSVLIFGGTVTNITVNGQTMFAGTVQAPIFLGPDDTISITYSSVPSWIWWPQ